jgi:hypothetical protein
LPSSGRTSGGYSTARYRMSPERIGDGLNPRNSVHSHWLGSSEPVPSGPRIGFPAYGSRAAICETPENRLPGGSEATT